MGDQLLEAGPRRGGRGQEHVATLDGTDHRRQLLERIEAQVLRGQRQDCQVGGDGRQHGVAIGRLVQDIFHADGPVRAATVFHDDGLAQCFRHFFGQDARDDIGRSARRIRHDEMNNLIGKGLCQR